MDFNEEKMKELIVYLAERSAEDVFWGTFKLNKLLFFCDFLAYLSNGEAMTGGTYVAEEYGPVFSEIRSIRAQMLEAGDVRSVKGTGHSRLERLREPNMQLFSSGEVRIIDSVVNRCQGSSEEEVSDLSHRFIGWQAAVAEGEATGNYVAIPYETVFVRNPSVSEEEIQQTLALATEHEWPI